MGDILGRVHLSFKEIKHVFLFCRRAETDCVPPPPLVFMVGVYLPGGDCEKRTGQKVHRDTTDVGPPCSVHTHHLSSLCGRQTTQNKPLLPFLGSQRWNIDFRSTFCWSGEREETRRRSFLRNGTNLKVRTQTFAEAGKKYEKPIIMNSSWSLWLMFDWTHHSLILKRWGGACFHFIRGFHNVDHNLNNLQIIQLKHNNILILGDFNKHVCFLSRTVDTDWLESLNCTQVILDFTHWIWFYWSLGLTTLR